MSKETFRCSKCGKFAKPSTRHGYCGPCNNNYHKEWRAKNKLKKNKNLEENIASSSNGVVKSDIPENSGGSRIPPEFSGGHMNFGNPQYPINYPMNPYLNMIPPQNSQIDNVMIAKLVARLDVLEKKNEELEKEVLFLKQNSGIDPNVKLDPHPYGEEYEPKLHPRELEMRICYNDIQLSDLVKSTIKGIIFKSLDEIQASMDDYEERLDKLEKETKCLDDIGLEIGKLNERGDLKELERRLNGLERQVKQQKESTDNRFNISGDNIEHLEKYMEKSKKLINWLILVEAGNEREHIIIDLFNSVQDLVEIHNKQFNPKIRPPEWPDNYRKFNDIEKRRTEAEYLLKNN